MGIVINYSGVPYVDIKHLDFMSSLHGLESFCCDMYQDQLLFPFIVSKCPNIKVLKCPGFDLSSNINLPHIRILALGQLDRPSNGTRYIPPLYPSFLHAPSIMAIICSFSLHIHACQYIHIHSVTRKLPTLNWPILEELDLSNVKIPLQLDQLQVIIESQQQLKKLIVSH